jgi:hypothetical protein
VNWYPYDKFVPGDGDDVEPEWQLWGDGKEPVSTGTEFEVKQDYTDKVIDNASLDDYYYLQDPEGHEWEFDGGKWVQSG